MVSRLGGLPALPASAGPSSRTNPSSINCATRLETVARVSPVARAMAARLVVPWAAIVWRAASKFHRRPSSRLVFRGWRSVGLCISKFSELTNRSSGCQANLGSDPGVWWWNQRESARGTSSESTTSTNHERSDDEHTDRYLVGGPRLGAGRVRWQRRRVGRRNRHDYSEIEPGDRRQRRRIGGGLRRRGGGRTPDVGRVL